jgi:hypothetical protein
MVMSAMSRDRDPGSPETGHRRPLGVDVESVRDRRPGAREQVPVPVRCHPDGGVAEVLLDLLHMAAIGDQERRRYVANHGT